VSEELLYTAPFGLPPRRNGSQRLGVRGVLLAGAAVVILIVGLAALLLLGPRAAAADAASEPRPAALSLITPTPEEGFALALRLSRLGVTETQPDREVLHQLRPGYAIDAESLIAASHVVAVHFQTVAAANDYWR
jgi:hypothetical protein